ncbi:MAG TPA: hypothetical protein VHE30_05515 [Polyangiaceae bacterium]|nr:hypothetical protein [Polyangiaceae bacterium]
MQESLPPTSSHRSSLVRRAWGVLVVAVVSTAVGCKDSAKISAAQAVEHVRFLSETVVKDVGEVRSGLPDGAKEFSRLLAADPTVKTDPKNTADALAIARRKVQDLRISKGTFFAFADDSFVVVRNDQEQDRMAGKSLLASFPGLAAAKAKYTETMGSMPEAAGVRAPRADGQWIAGAPVVVAGELAGVYVTGWSWSSYAYRLEFALRGKIRSELSARREENEPLVYVFVVVGDSVYGAPVSPDVTRSTLSALHPLTRATGDAIASDKVEITGRQYGYAVQRTPMLGENVGILVLRSET